MGGRTHATHEAISFLFNFLFCSFFFSSLHFPFSLTPYFSPHTYLSPTTCDCLFPSAPSPPDHLLAPLFSRETESIRHTPELTHHMRKWLGEVINYFRAVTLRGHSCLAQITLFLCNIKHIFFFKLGADKSSFKVTSYFCKHPEVIWMFGTCHGKSDALVRNEMRLEGSETFPEQLTCGLSKQFPGGMQGTFEAL